MPTKVLILELFLTLTQGVKLSNHINQLSAAKMVASMSSKIDQTSAFHPGNLSMLICGIIILCFAIPMIWLNERKLARIYYVLNRAKAEVVDKQDVNAPTWQNNFKLVHCTGKSKTEVPVRDERFNINFNQCIRLVRRVEMLQWVEIKREE